MHARLSSKSGSQPHPTFSDSTQPTSSVSLLSSSIMALSEKLNVIINAMHTKIREAMQMLPEHPAEAGDYHAWAETFANIVVSVADHN